jgi:hypothetical protein
MNHDGFRRGFVAKCRQDPESLTGTYLTFKTGRATVKKIKPHKDGAFLVYFKDRTVERSGFFYTYDKEWGPHESKPSEAFVQKSVDRHMQTLPDVSGVYSDLFVYLALFFGSEQRLQDNIEVQWNYKSENSDSYSPSSFSCVTREGVPTIYFGPRELFLKTNFCQNKNVEVFVNLQSKGKMSLCEDTAIEAQPNPILAASKICQELRWIMRQLLPGVPNFSSSKQLGYMAQTTINNLLKKLDRALGKAHQQTWVIACGAGRTRSATVVLFIQLAFHVLGLCVEKNTEKLLALKNDISTSLLGDLRAAADSAMENRKATRMNSPRKDQSTFTADRFGRFYNLLRCFSMGQS